MVENRQQSENLKGRQREKHLRKIEYNIKIRVKEAACKYKEWVRVAQPGSSGVAL